VCICVHRDLILTLHHHNKCTTTLHMMVDLSMWNPLSCEELLCNCYIGVVNLTFFRVHIYLFLFLIG
jgi:hypothetical protein